MSNFSLAKKEVLEVNTTVFKHPKYELVRKIADGAEGVVWEATNNVNGLLLALKFYKSREKWEHEKMIIKEVRTRCVSNHLIIIL